MPTNTENQGDEGQPSAGRPVAFLITPFSPETAGGERREIFDAVQAAIRGAAQSAGVDLLRADDIFAPGVIIDQVRSAIERADVVLAVCTGKNANVYYELGLAAMMEHKPILIAAGPQDLAFDMRHWRTHFYSGEATTDDLAARLVHAIGAALDDRRSDPSVIVREAQEPEGPGSDPVALIRQGDEVGFQEEFKARLRSALDAHEALATDNAAIQPTQETWAELQAARFGHAESLLGWLLPVVEYRPNWLERPLRALNDAFHRKAIEGSGYALWQHIHQSWSYLTLKGLTAAAAILESAPTIEHLLSQRGTDPERDEAPLLINPAFTWAAVVGDADVLFKDFLGFVGQSPAVGDIRGSLDAEDVTCWADLILGLARCQWEAKTGSRHWSGDEPYHYAGFARFYCNRIAGIARVLENSNDIAVAMGASGREEFRTVCREWYPRLRSRSNGSGHFRVTCDSWEEALRWR